MMNERNSIQKTTSSMIPFIWPSKKAKLFYGERNQNSGFLVWGAECREFSGDGNGVYLDGSESWLYSCMNLAKLSTLKTPPFTNAMLLLTKIYNKEFTDSICNCKSNTCLQKNKIK